MKKINRLPREQANGKPDEHRKNTDDGLNVGADVEGHRIRPGFAPRLPGTGGDFRRPSGGGEVDGAEGDDVEGHIALRFSPQSPGTGGDQSFRRPSGGGEIDGGDTEGPQGR